jgi:hypothetical protein
MSTTQTRTHTHTYDTTFRSNPSPFCPQPHPGKKNITPWSDPQHNSKQLVVAVAVVLVLKVTALVQAVVLALVVVPPWADTANWALHTPPSAAAAAVADLCSLPAGKVD